MRKYQVGDKITVELTVVDNHTRNLVLYSLLGPDKKAKFWLKCDLVDKWDVLKHTPAPREWKVGDVYYNELDQYERQVLFIDDNWVIRMEKTPSGPKSYVFSRLQWDSDENKVFIRNVND